MAASTRPTSCAFLLAFVSRSFSGSGYSSSPAAQRKRHPQPLAVVLAGGKGLEAKSIPNLTPTRLKSWTDADLKEFFLSGATPDGDAAAEPMAEVIRNSTSQLLPVDLAAIIAYLRSLPANPDEPR